MEKISLTPEEVHHFLTNVLQMDSSTIPEEITVKDSKKSLHFLNLLIPAFMEHEPFQSISLMSKDISDRGRPSWTEIKQDILSSHGGMCYSLNLFMYVLLRTMGFDVSLGFSTVRSGQTFVANNHIVIFVSCLIKPGDLYLVDVGLGTAILKAIPLDFENQSPCYTDSFLTYKFLWRSKTRIVCQRFTKDGVAARKPQDLDEEKIKTDVNYFKSDDESLLLSNGPVNETSTSSQVKTTENPNRAYMWKDLYEFDIQDVHKSPEVFYDQFDDLYSDPSKLVMHFSPRIVHWKNGKLEAVVHSKLILENDEGELVKTQLILEDSKNCATGHSLSDKSEGAKNNIDEDECLVKVYVKHFPQFSEANVRKAIKNWRKGQSELSPPAHFR